MVASVERGHVGVVLGMGPDGREGHPGGAHGQRQHGAERAPDMLPDRFHHAHAFCPSLSFLRFTMRSAMPPMPSSMAAVDHTAIMMVSLVWGTCV